MALKNSNENTMNQYSSSMTLNSTKVNDITETHRQNGRNTALDFVKGVLVLSMVLYHSLNYFMNNSILFRYLRFIAPGFIFISGFMVTNVLYLKYGAHFRSLSSRLVSKGIKLVAIFTCLNIVINFAFNSNYGGRELGIRFFFQNALSIYYFGIDKMAAFGILLPIGYLYIFASFVLWMTKRSRYFLFLLSIGLIIYVTIYSLYFKVSGHVWSITFGFFGMTLGLIPVQKINKLLVHKLYIVFLFTIYLVIISIFSQPFLLQVFGTVLTLSFFYAIGMSPGCKGIIAEGIYLLGRFSLVSYIIQIVILQVIYRFSILNSGEVKSILIAFSITLVLTFAFIEILNLSIQHSRVIKKLYRVIFI